MEIVVFICMCLVCLFPVIQCNDFGDYNSTDIFNDNYTTSQLKSCHYDTECTYENSYCYNREYCLCKTGFVPKKNGDGCVEATLPPCPLCLESISNSECIRNVCYCKDGFIISSDKTRCLEYAKCYRHNCTEDIQCSTLSRFSVCINSECVCQQGFIFNHERKICESILEELIQVNFDFENYKIIDPSQTELFLQCNVSDNDQFDLQWRKNGVLLASGCNKRIKFINPENKMVIERPIEEDSGNYTCTFVPKISGTTVSAVIELVVKPSVELLMTSAFLGENLELVCELTGNPLPIVEWLFNNATLNVSDERLLIQSDFRKGKHVSVMTLYNVSFDDSGTYTCFASSKVIQEHIQSSLEIAIKERKSAWIPFLGICGEVLVLCVVIFATEKRHIRNMKKQNEANNKQ